MEVGSMTQWEYKVVNTAGLISHWTKKGVEMDLAALEQQMNQLGWKAGR